MTREELCAKIEEAIQSFALKGNMESYSLYGNGHINDTFLLKVRSGNQTIPYILQRMNHEIFKNPVTLIDNIAFITGFLRKKIILKGGDPERETLNLVPAKDGKFYYEDSIGSYWRVYQYISNATSLDYVKNEQVFYHSAVAFGNFQNLLADYPVSELHETIANFHNTKIRYQALYEAVEADVFNRAKEVRDEIDFAFSHREIANTLMDMLDRKQLPLRVTHNDTKLNNIMIDNITKKAICIIDLDTVMPGLSAYDFGDAIRFGASTGAEDEMDLSKVDFDLKLFEVYTRGFIEGSNHSLTEHEIKSLPYGALTMTYECGIRFLMDYLQGDNYFKTSREKQNLDRCRTQFKLVRGMEKNWSYMKDIVSQY